MYQIVHQIQLGMFNNKKSNHSPQSVFLSKFQSLSQLLLEDNYTNVRNLNQCNHNFNEVFSYLKGIIRNITAKYQMLQKRNEQLQAQLQRLDKSNNVLSKKTDSKLDLGYSGNRLAHFTPLVARQTDSFAKRFAKPAKDQQNPQKSMKSSVNRENFKKETEVIEQFIVKHLSKTLIEDKTKKELLPKGVLVNLYLRWCEARGHSLLIDKMMIIKTQITNELKKVFPNMGHNEKHYFGIAFKPSIICDFPQMAELKSVQNWQDSIEQNEVLQDEGLSYNLQFQDLDYDSQYQIDNQLLL